MSIESRLAEARRDLDAHIERIESEAKANGSASISFGKRIGDGSSVAVERLNEIAVLERLTKQRRMVIRAQAKVVEGSYAICDACASPITPSRIDALPWALHCLTCADIESVPAAEEPTAAGNRPDAGPRPASTDATSPWDDVQWSAD